MHVQHGFGLSFEGYPGRHPKQNFCCQSQVAESKKPLRAGIEASSGKSMLFGIHVHHFIGDHEQSGHDLQEPTKRRQGTILFFKPINDDSSSPRRSYTRLQRRCERRLVPSLRRLFLKRRVRAWTFAERICIGSLKLLLG
jgi:hypothetical protein